MKRRSILGAGVAAAAGASLGPFNGSIAGRLPPVPPMPSDATMTMSLLQEPENFLDYLRDRAAKMAMLKATGLPPGLEGVLRRNHIGDGEPQYDDIDALRSVSMAGKRWMRDDRMTAWRLDSFLNGAQRQLRHELRRQALHQLGLEL